MTKSKKFIIVSFLIMVISLTGCATAQPAVLGRSNVVEVKDNNIIDSIEPIVIEPTDKEIREEAKYRLIQYSELKCIENNPIEKGDVIYISVSLYDSKKNKLVDYDDVDIDFIVGDYEFDNVIEDSVIGKNGDVIGFTIVKGTVFEKVEGASFFELKIENAENYVYPELTESFLKNNFDVSTKKEFYNKIKKEVEAMQYELELNEVEDELVEKLICNSVFNEKFNQRIEERYNVLINKYEDYGKLYGMTLDEVLDSLEMDREEVKMNARKFQGEWELALYFLNKNEIGFTEEELELKKEKYAKENGYNSVEELINDSGEQYLLEQIYIKKMKDYLYEKYVGEIEQYEN